MSDFQTGHLKMDSNNVVRKDTPINTAINQEPPTETANTTSHLSQSSSHRMLQYKFTVRARKKGAHAFFLQHRGAVVRGCIEYII